MGVWWRRRRRRRRGFICEQKHASVCKLRDPVNETFFTRPYKRTYAAKLFAGKTKLKWACYKRDKCACPLVREMARGLCGRVHGQDFPKKRDTAGSPPFSMICDFPKIVDDTLNYMID